MRRTFDTATECEAHLRRMEGKDYLPPESRAAGRPSRQRRVVQAHDGSALYYEQGRCLCGACRAAARRRYLERNRGLRKRFLASPSSFEHGRAATYVAGCRCHACRSAKR